jgi:hypothetical protein
MARTPARRTVLAAGLTFSTAAIGITTLGFALNTHSWDELEIVLVPPLIVGAALAAGWACVLGVGLLVQWTWTRWWALLTFVVVSAFSGLALFDTVRRVVPRRFVTLQHLPACRSWPCPLSCCSRARSIDPEVMAETRQNCVDLGHRRCDGHDCGDANQRADDDSRSGELYDASRRVFGCRRCRVCSLTAGSGAGRRRCWTRDGHVYRRLMLGHRAGAPGSLRVRMSPWCT